MEKVGYMGIPGSFSEVAAQSLLEKAEMTDAQPVPLVSAGNILEALEKREISYGVLGVTNSTAGPVGEFHDAFDDVPYEVLGEYVMPIHHCLFKKPGVPVEALTQVASHPQALSQTKETRAQYFPMLKEREIDDTALGAEWLSKGTLPEDCAVICSSRGGELWGLDKIAENIEDSSTNRTTFWLLRLSGE